MDTLSYKTISVNKATAQKEWVVVDATDQVIGRLGTKVAKLLRGKYKPSFTPNVDCGDHVVVINAAQAVLTGNKLEDKFYRHHSGWVGGLKEIKYATLMKNNPEKAMMVAIKGMLPDNTLGRKALTRVRIYRDANHSQEAQQPKAWNE